MEPRSTIAIQHPSVLPADLRRRPIMTQAPTDTPLPQASDDVLITLLQAGEERAFRVLVERYEERIHNLLYSIFHDRDFVDDLAQDIFVKAYEALGQFRFESSFYTWLYRIAVNKSRDELRRRKLRRFFSLQSLDDGTRAELEARMAQPPVDREIPDLIAMGLRSLPDHHREVVVLKDLEGFSYEEIAEILQIEVGTVKSRLSRARGALKTILAPLVRERGT